MVMHMALRSRCTNLPSSRENKHVIWQNIASELEKGRLVGPVRAELFPDIQVSIIRSVPKGHLTGRWRVIVDLSVPHHFSVNDGITEEVCTLSYALLDDAVGLIRHLGPGTEHMKMDLKDAYRADHHVLGISWDGLVYIDRALLFGLQSVPNSSGRRGDMVPSCGGNSVCNKLSR